MITNANEAGAAHADLVPSNSAAEPTTSTTVFPIVQTSTAESAVEAARMLEVLGFEPDDRVSVCSLATGGVFQSQVEPVKRVGRIAATLADRDCWIGANPLRAGIGTGRGTAADVIGVRALWADLDVKPGGMPSNAAARVVIATLSDMLGVEPAVVVMSGHGLQPRWLVERGVGTDWTSPTETAPREATALVRRFGRLVQHVAEVQGGAADNVSDLARVLRAPGTTNCKGAPVRTTLELPGGAPVSLKRLAETLDEYGIPEAAEDREALDAVLAAPSSWSFGGRTCAYVAGMVAGWTVDKPAARHPWLVAQALRLAAAHRSGCITESDHRLGLEALAARFRTRLNVGAKRKETPGEIAGAVAWGRLKVATFTDDRTTDELGRHDHPGEALTIDHEPTSLAGVHATFAKWLGPAYDLEVLDAVLAVAAAGLHLSGDPAWLLIVAGSGMTKTETVSPLAAAGAILTSTIGSESALLSGTSRKERVSDATGGLMRRVGNVGLLVLKDVTTILSMPREARGMVLAALREIFDGRWDRPVGSDGGQTLTWEGRCIVIGAVTTAWDEAHAVVAAMGDRFLLVRPPEEDARAAGVAALRVQGRESEMRAELGEAVGGLLQHVEPTAGDVDTPDALILDLADVVTWSRTAVETDYRGDVLGAHAREAPTRFAKELQALYRGGRLIGLDEGAAQHLVIRVARDSMPPRRRAVLRALLDQEAPETTYALAARADLPRSTVDRHLQALQALHLATHLADAPSWRWALAPGVDRPSLALLCASGSAIHRRLSASSDLSALASPSTSSTSHSLNDIPGRAEPCPGGGAHGGPSCACGAFRRRSRKGAS